MSIIAQVGRFRNEGWSMKLALPLTVPPPVRAFNV